MFRFKCFFFVSWSRDGNPLSPTIGIPVQPYALFDVPTRVFAKQAYNMSVQLAFAVLQEASNLILLDFKIVILPSISISTLQHLVFSGAYFGCIQNMLYLVV